MSPHRALSCLLLCLTVALPTGSLLAQTGSLIGTWTGTAAQNVGKSGYTVLMTITATGGQTDYPELNCGGVLTRVGAANGYVFYTEKITRGRLGSGGTCIDGAVTVALTGDNLAWGWVAGHQGKAVLAWGTLTRK